MWAGQSFAVAKAFTENGTLTAAQAMEKLLSGVEELKKKFSQQGQ
jgi:hypothetical protein